MDRRVWYIIGFAIVAGICVLAFVVAPSGEFGGSDDQGGNQIQQIDPSYHPWFQSLWTPPEETASLLFAVQAAIGAIIIGYFIGNERGKRVASERMKAAQTQAAKEDPKAKKAEN